MDKYYTPNIEELYVGFECEVKHNDGTWNKLIYDEGHLASIMFEKKSIEEKNIRVKYLDKEDIESFGYLDYVLSEYNVTEFSIPNTKIKLYCYLNLENIVDGNIAILLNNVVTCNKCKNIFDHTLFTGEIKNKSEFKKLIKQLT